MAKKKATTKKRLVRKITKEDLNNLALAASAKVRQIQAAVFSKIAELKPKKKTTKKKTSRKPSKKKS